MKKLLFGLLFFLLYQNTFAQAVIEMEEYGGIYRIPCKVNGAKMKLIFDTGAESVCLSLTMADYLYDNDFITDDDIIGYGSTTVADGSIVDHIKIILKDIEIQDIHLRNVEAVVIDGQNAPLLLGQSAIKKLGGFSIYGNKLIIGTNTHSSSPMSLTEEDADRLINEADKAYKEKAYYIALEKYKIVYDNGWLNAIGKYIYANCYFHVEKNEEALYLYTSILEDIELKYPQYIADIYIQIAACNNRLNNTDDAIVFLEKAKYYAVPWSTTQAESVKMLSATYFGEGNDVKGELTMKNYIQEYLDFKNYQLSDCWDKGYSDSFLSCLYFEFSCLLFNDDERDFYRMLAAAWGNEEARKICDIFSIDYKNNPRKIMSSHK